MSSDNTNGAAPGDLTMEQRILRMVKKVLTDVAKDTVTPAGLKHPLSQDTIMGIRECLALITARESELLQEAGVENTQKPRFADQGPDHVVVPITPAKKADSDQNDNE